MKTEPQPIEVPEDREPWTIDNPLHSIDFEFGLNDSRFSDRVLHLQVTSVLEEGSSDMQGKEVESGKKFIVDFKILHISSIILAAQSSFFMKLFSSGMQESTEKEVTICIQASEEAAFMDLLKFMYTGSLRAMTTHELLDVLVAADKFGVSNCSQFCINQILPLTLDSALLCFELPATVLQNEKMQPLMELARAFMIDYFTNFTRCKEEGMKLSLPAIEPVLSSDKIKADTEDEIYDFLFAWATQKYANLGERNQVLSSLVSLIRFPMMTVRKLRMVMNEEHDGLQISNFLLEAFAFKAELPCRQHHIQKVTTHKRFVERAYKRKPVKVVEFDKPYRHFLVYLNLCRDECRSLAVEDRIYSQDFELDWGIFYVFVEHERDQRSELFGLYMGLKEKSLSPSQVQCSWSLFAKPSMSYNKTVTVHSDSEVNEFGFNQPWSYFLSQTSSHFIEGFLHVQIEISACQKK